MFIFWQRSSTVLCHPKMFCSKRPRVCKYTFFLIRIDVRPSVHDEDWVQSNFKRPSSSQTPQSFREGNRMQGNHKWRPQTTTPGTTQVGFSTTSIQRNVNIVGLGNTGSTNLDGGMPMGFMTSRQALASLPLEQVSLETTARKRKADPQSSAKTSKPKSVESTKTKSSSVVSQESLFPREPLPFQQQTKVRSTGVRKDGAKPIRNLPAIPKLQSSSPAPDYNVDKSPPISDIEDEFLSPRTTKLKTPRAHPVKTTTAHKQQAGVKIAPVQKKALGTGRNMRPWGLKRQF